MRGISTDKPYAACTPDRDEIDCCASQAIGDLIMDDSRQDQSKARRRSPDELRIVLASPNDVLEERRVFFEIVAEINTLLRNLGKPFHLEPVAWERSTFPDTGVPQRVISKQLLIQDCHIFVAVFWTRFGTPIGEIRPDDGKPYLSGSEQEIDEAFEARRENKNGRPTIMLYRKRNDVPSGMNDDDYLQYSRVVQFFRQTAPGGRYEALYAEFRGAEFGALLKEHLLRAVNDIEKGERLLLKSVNTIDPKQQWFRQVRLTGNPFAIWTAEQETKLESYYLSIGEHRLHDLVQEPKHWTLFAAPGYGKTALAKMVETQCYPRKPGSKVLFLRFGQLELHRVLQQQSGNGEVLDPQLFLRYLIQSAVETTNPLTTSNAGQTAPTTQLVSLLESVGLQKALCIIDQLDEVAVVKGDPVRIAALLKPIMLPAFREPLLPHLTFRYFLPSSVEIQFDKEATQFRSDRCRVTHITWGITDLKNLIRERIVQFADPPGSVRSLGSLCEPTNGFATRIEDDIARLAEGSPRAAIWLGNRLIEFHCQDISPARFVREVTWFSVQQDWLRWGRKQILGAADRTETFWIRGADVFFSEHQVALTPQNTRLMQALIIAGDTMCSKDDLRKAGWPNDNPAGITDRALSEGIQRLRHQLAEKGFDSKLVHTERDRGYRLLRQSLVV